MKRVNLLAFLLIFTFGISIAQEESNYNDIRPFSLGLHYTGNLKNENGFSDNYNGILGLDVRYKFASRNSVNFQAGISFDYFKGKDFKESYSVEYNNALFINPHFGVELAVKETGFKPFLNLGYSFNYYSYTIYGNGFSVFDPSDPSFSGYGSKKINENDAALTLQPGLRYCFKNGFYSELSYKYLPIESNVNVHLINLGLGYNF
ncbi:outer membrane beta-barrel protein [Flavobacterium urocaniciphilum]|uniref:Outer membrane protein beta-barrel domain-containing protein n=1 Tax=Flavobacterium urocaniciphilum TaxID=1299341 RepID=A0A1H8YS76_9FLAO|nr:outer membrane beta-barrel protein [Flavobacterium urocaniciphilum]SEP55065.1 Outer membrane protein beta-barrel domain-containing protein [Flavobacterium urocaniciphilum]